MHHFSIQKIVTGPLDVNTYIVPFASAVSQQGIDIFIVDPGGNAPALIAEIDSFCSQGSQLRGIILTHGHFDHIIALAQIAAAYPNASVLIHHEDAFYVGADALAAHEKDFSRFGAASLVHAYGVPLPPASAFLEEGTVLFDSPWCVMHTPGHSRGSLCLYNAEEKILISGDTAFKNSIGRTDLPNGSYADLRKSLLRILLLPPDTRILPGHGHETSVEPLAEFLKFSV